MALEWLAIVPARKGSVGVPGKNRRAVGGSSLVELAIRRALIVTNGNPGKVVVSTDDPFCSRVAASFGCKVHARSEDLSGPSTTIAEVVERVLEDTGFLGAVAIVQPTSPTLSEGTVGEIIAEFEATPGFLSLATVTEESHFLWSEDQNGIVAPLFDERVNRQDRNSKVWRETGGLMLVREWTGTESLVSDAHHLWPVSAGESVDIDLPLDLVFAKAVASSKIVEWRVVAGGEVGFGHIFRSLALAEEMIGHSHRWVVDGPDEAVQIIGDAYPVIRYGRHFETPADLVIFDSLEMGAEEYRTARLEGSFVAAFELLSLPEGAYLDFYFDELASEFEPFLHGRIKNSRKGSEIASVRDEFRAARTSVLSPQEGEKEVPDRILVTFGGEDSRQMTEQVLEVLAGLFPVRAVVGPGFSREYAHRLRQKWPASIIESSEVEMAKEMLAAEVVLTSGGRTSWEAAFMGCSTLAVPVNERERAHCLPPTALRVPAESLDSATLKESVQLAFAEARSGITRHERSVAAGVDGKGPARIAWLIEGLLNGLL